jgi:hypothetical protein
VNIDVLLGDSPPPPIVDIYMTFCKDMWRKGQWKMDCIALPVYHLAKFFHKRIKQQSCTRSCVDSRIKVLIVMYQYFQDKVTRVKKEHISTVAAARKGMEKKSSRKSLPDGFQVWPQDGESMMAWQWLDNGWTGSTDQWLDGSMPQWAWWFHHDNELGDAICLNVVLGHVWAEGDHVDGMQPPAVGIKMGHDIQGRDFCVERFGVL